MARGDQVAIEVLGRLEAGEPPARVVASVGLTSAELIAAVVSDGLDGVDGGPLLVQTTPRRPRLAPALSETALVDLFPEASRPSRLALSAGLLQIHDFWEASHTAAQEADDLGESRATAYWHGIAHRREPDPGNAAYWFRRVGRHLVFVPLADAARPLLADDTDLGARLLPQGSWNPFAFIDLCTRARGEQAALARRLQRIEMRLLIEASMPV